MKFVECPNCNAKHRLYPISQFSLNPKGEAPVYLCDEEVQRLKEGDVVELGNHDL